MLQTHPRTEEFFETFLSNPEQAVERIDGIINFEEDSSNLDTLANEILEGAIPIIYANHQSFADGLVLSRVTRQLMERTELEGFKIPASATGESQPLHSALLPIYHDRGLFPVGVYTDEELETLGPDEQRINRKAALSLLKGPSEGFGLAVFPEASPEGGIKTQDGGIRGIQQLKRDDLRGYHSIFQKRYKNRDVLFVPVGIDGSYNIYQPETNGPGELAVRTVCDGELLETFVDLTVGEPINANNLDGDFNSLLMAAVAELLPYHAKGYYL
ncbi:hypothetical protein KDA00_04605 [Candidatus Saccharibacteria bacterium]|nr:hypothetical protein [Candidatus Saccharibacteria bacterium]